MRLSLDNSRISLVAVGDSYVSDVVGAKASGMLTCWLNRGQSVTPGERPKADFLVSGLKQLGEILREP